MENTKCTILSSDTQLTESLTATLSRVPNIELVRGLNNCTNCDAVVRFFQRSPARIAFLDLRDPGAIQIPQEMELHDPALQFIGLGEPPTANQLLLGVQEQVALPLDGAALDAAIRRRVRVLAKFPDRSRQPTAFLSFLPSKPGSGASTLACGLADALSKDHNTLLCDFDMATGSVAFRYRLESQHAMPEVSEKLEAVDEQLWSQVVSRSGDLDILPSSVRVPTQHPRANQLSKWFEFLRSKYDVVIFDLSGHLEDYTFEVMQHCRQIFLITTQELENLHHARTKADALRRYGLDEQTSVVLNRFQKTHTLKQSDVEDITRMKVRAQFPNDYLALQESVREGGGLKPGTALHKALATFAPNATEMKPPEREAKFVEYFTLPLFNYWRRGNSRSEQWT